MPADCICKYLRGRQAPTQPMNQINAAGMEAVIRVSEQRLREDLHQSIYPINYLFILWMGKIFLKINMSCV